MSHVDEGRLHEYLDRQELAASVGGAGGAEGAGGADLREIETHLAECADCRALLDEVRRVRARASDILSASGPPDAAAPPFEEILARKRARSQQRGLFRMNRLSAVGWAATVVFAVGVGWIARGQLANRSADQVAPAGYSMTAGATSDSSPAPALPTAQSDAPAGAPGGQAVNEEGGAGAVGEPPPASAPQAASELRAPSEPEMASQVGVASAGAPARRDAARAAEDVETGVSEEQRQAMAARARTSRADSVARAVAAPAAAEQFRLEREEPEAAARLAPRAAVAPEPAQGGRVLDLWAPTTEEAARQVLGREPIVVPDLPVLDLAMGSMAGRSAVLVRQQLASGAALTLVQWRDLDADAAAGDAAGEAPLGDYPADAMGADSAESQVVFTLGGGYVVVARAPIPQDSLEAVLERIR